MNFWSLWTRYSEGFYFNCECPRQWQSFLYLWCWLWFVLRCFVIIANNISCLLARRKYVCLGVMSFLEWETYRFLCFNLKTMSIFWNRVMMWMTCAIYTFGFYAILAHADPVLWCYPSNPLYSIWNSLRVSVLSLLFLELLLKVWVRNLLWLGKLTNQGQPMGWMCTGEDNWCGML